MYIINKKKNIFFKYKYKLFRIKKIWDYVYTHT